MAFRVRKFFGTFEKRAPQSRVVRKVDNAIQWIAWFVLLTLIHWIANYPVDSVIQSSKNRGQGGEVCILHIV